MGISKSVLDLDSVPFAVAFEMIITRTVTDFRREAWKTALKDFREIIGLADEMLKSKTKGCLGVRYIETQGPPPGHSVPRPPAPNGTIRHFDIVLWNYAEAKMLTLLDRSEVHRNEEYPIASGTRDLLFFNRNALESYILGLFNNPQAPAAGLLSQVFSGLNIEVGDGEAHEGGS